ncbi:hypothetical protein Barb7_02077 [Bacteroidales bacterium Barb7]|nr:hypothetical protein Barb7_02077 [Bacteroidales bacterium Barb7]
MQSIERGVRRQGYFQGVEIVAVQLPVTELFQFAGQESGLGMDAACYVAKPFHTMVNSIEACHSGKQRLCGADVGGSLFALDMLFARLQSQTVSRVPVSIFGNADDTSGH